MIAATTEPIALISMGCRFPGGVDNPEAFWQLLQDGKNPVADVPPERWDIDRYYDPTPHKPGKMYTRQGSFLEQVDQFDPLFFGISPREAVMIDPQQRLLLEVSWESLERAGISPHQLQGSKTGVFMAMVNHDYSELILQADPQAIDNQNSVLGIGISAAAGRLAYVLGLHGPTLTVDTACSSSLVALHLACQSLRLGECSLALAGGVNLILTPQATIAGCAAQVLSPDGRCRTFDATAEGLGRGEGGGVVVLKRLSDATRDGDRILAVIRGSAVNHEGRTKGFMAPNQDAQVALIRQALSHAGVEPHQISYVEAHGTATPVGDPVEVAALRSVFAESHSPEHPLVIASVKTNIGHLEGAAGMAGLIKVVLQLQNQEIAPHLHCQHPNPDIPWDEFPVVVPQQPMPWLVTKQPQRAGISAFGITGTIAHVVVESAPEIQPAKPQPERPAHLFTVSAKTPSALKQLVARYEQHIRQNPNLDVGEICLTTNTGRSHFPYRLSFVVSTTAELQQKLANTMAQADSAVVFPDQGVPRKPPKLAFYFPDVNSDPVSMARQFYETQPIFQRTVQQCDQLLRAYLDKPLLEFLYPQAGESAFPQETVYRSVALFAVDYALFQVWKSWGIEPTVISGHGVGEYVAATVAGVLSWEDSLKLIASKHQLTPSDLRTLANHINDSTPQIPLISPITGQPVVAEMATPDDWVDQGSEVEPFQPSQEIWQAQGIEKVVEISPELSDWQPLLDTLGKLYLSGVAIDWCRFEQDYPRQTVVLPTYPFQRQRYWIETSPRDPFSENSFTELVNLLKQVDIQQLAKQPEVSEKFSPEQIQLLPKVLSLLVQENINVVGDKPDENEQKNSSETRKIRDQLEQVTSSERWDLLFDFLKDELVSLLKIEDHSDVNVSQGFFDLGMDSLIAMELSKRLQGSLDIRVSDTVSFEYSNLDELTTYLLSQLYPEKLSTLDEPNVKADTSTATPDQFSETVTNLSTDELYLSIEEELAKIEASLNE